MSYIIEDSDNLSQSILSTGERTRRFDHGWWMPVSSFRVEGDSFLLSVRTVGIMLPLSAVKRPLECGAHYDRNHAGTPRGPK